MLPDVIAALKDIHSRQRKLLRTQHAHVSHFLQIANALPAASNKDLKRPAKSAESGLDGAQALADASEQVAKVQQLVQRQSAALQQLQDDIDASAAAMAHSKVCVSIVSLLACCQLSRAASNMTFTSRKCTCVLTQMHRKSLETEENKEQDLCMCIVLAHGCFLRKHVYVLKYCAHICLCRSTRVHKLQAFVHSTRLQPRTC